MILEFIKFEWIYRKKRSATWIYFSLVFIFTAFLSNLVISVNGSNSIKNNYNLSAYVFLLSLVFTPIVSAIVGVTNLRDSDYSTKLLLMTKPISIRKMFVGRFIGAVLVLNLIFIGVIPGVLINYFIAESAFPNLAWLKNLFVSYVLVIIPNIFFLSALFYTIASLSKNRILIFSQGFLYFILFQVANNAFSLVRGIGINKYLEPIGFWSFAFDTQYLSTIARVNHQILFDSVLITNRLIYFGVGLFIFLIGVRFFKLSIDINEYTKKAKIDKHYQQSFLSKFGFLNKTLEMIEVTSFNSFLKATLFYARITSRDLFFIIICSVGLLFTVYQLYNQFVYSNRPPYPLSQNIFPLISDFISVFIQIFAIYHAGSIIYREKNIKFASILGTLPTQKWMFFTAKLVGFVLVTLVMSSCVALVGIIFQKLSGDAPIRWMAYFISVVVFPVVEISTLICIFIFVQAIVSHRGFGPIASVILLLMIGLSPRLGIEGPLVHFYSPTSTPPYSDWISFGFLIKPYIVAKIYWGAIGLILFTLAILIQRIDEVNLTFKERMASFKQRFTPQMKAIIAICLVLIGAIAFLQINNVHLKNKYLSYKTRNQIRADYEREFLQLDSLPQPSITKVALDLKMFESMFWHGNIKYKLKNQTTQNINQIIAVEPFGDPSFSISDISVSVGHSVEVNEKQKINFIKLNKALAPNDSIEMDFKFDYQPSVFFNGVVSNSRLSNGASFLSVQNLIHFGGSQNRIIKDSEDRGIFKLPPEREIISTVHPYFKNQNAVNDDANLVDVSIKLQTNKNLKPVGFEYIKVKKEDKNFDYYETELRQIPLYFGFGLGRYDQEFENIDGVSVSYNFHPEHKINAGTIKKATRDAITFFQKNLGRYPFKTLSIIEVPNISGGVSQNVTMPSTIVVDENFMTSQSFDLNLKYDRTYETIARGVVKQWFGFGLMPAKVNGDKFFMESIPSYLVGKLFEDNYNKYSRAQFYREISQFYRSERNSANSLEGAYEAIKNQEIIASRGSMILNSLEQQLGREKLLQILSLIYEKHAKSNHYVSLTDFKTQLSSSLDANKAKQVLSYFDEPIFYDLRIEGTPSLTSVDGFYVLKLGVYSRKYAFNKKGEEVEIITNEGYEIGLQDENDNVINLSSAKITGKKEVLEIKLKVKPKKIYLDPYLNYYEQVRRDNIQEL